MIKNKRLIEWFDNMGYIEDIIIVQKIQQDKKLMEDTRKYIVEVLKHIIQIIDNYIDARGKSKWDVITDDKTVVKGTYTQFLLHENKLLIKYLMFVFHHGTYIIS